MKKEKEEIQFNNNYQNFIIKIYL